MSESEREEAGLVKILALRGFCLLQGQLEELSALQGLVVVIEWGLMCLYRKVQALVSPSVVPHQPWHDDGETLLGTEVVNELSGNSVAVTIFQRLTEK